MDFYWLIGALSALPAALWVLFGLGWPAALLLLPRHDWPQRALVACLAFVLGPMLLTAWMFILGTLGGATENALLQFELIFIGTLMMALPLWGRVWHLRRTPDGATQAKPVFLWDEKLLLGLIVLALLVRFVVTAFWPFTAYDPLWVYGYQGRLYTLLGYIPQEIGYYPQFLPLQYSYLQLAVGGINDHAARIAVFMLHIGSMLGAYVLAKQLFSRRVGVIAAAVWALYPHVGEWARIGDLEIPLAFLFTTAAAFFLMAWQAESRGTRRRYALIAGVVFGVAMWTKPTAGAFVWGVLILLAFELLRLRFAWRRWWPRFEVALITGLACIPLGAAWYLRNILLGHPALVFPHPSWLERATQSGDLFGWPLLALILLLAYLYLNHRWRDERPDLWPLIGTGLILVALAPTFPWLNTTTRLNPPESRLLPTEWGLLALGAGVIVVALLRYARKRWTLQAQHEVMTLLYALLLALPYFITWFASYSYHFRLSFAIVPLLILPVAVLLVRWVPQPPRDPNRRLIYLAGLIALSLPGTLAAWYSAAPERDWLWSDAYPTDDARYRLQNPSIMLIVDALRGYEATHDTQPVVVAPGEDRLPFFFPLIAIDNVSRPTQLAEIEHATHFIYGDQARWRYEDENIPFAQNQIVSALGRADVMQLVLSHTDATFDYYLYEVQAEARFYDLEANPREFYGVPERVVFGDAIRFFGGGASSREVLFAKVFYDLLWEVLQPLESDYIMRFELVNLDDGQTYANFDAPVAPTIHNPHGYGTHLWEVGEVIIDRRVFQLENGAGIPVGQNYRMMISFEHPETGERLPITIDGEPAGDRYALWSPFYVGTG